MAGTSNADVIRDGDVVVSADTNGDGLVDAVAVDIGDDGVIDAVAADVSGDGVVDAIGKRLRDSSIDLPLTALLGAVVEVLEGFQRRSPARGR